MDIGVRMDGQNKRRECGIEDKSLTPASILRLALQEKKNLTIAGLFMTVSALATAGYAYLVGPMIRTLFMENRAPSLKTATLPALEKISFFLGDAPPTWIAAAIVATAAVKGGAFYAQTLLTAKSGQNVLHRLRCRLFKGLVQLPPMSPMARESGDLVARFTADVTTVETAVTKGVLAYVRHIIELAALAGLAMALDFRLGLIGLIAFPPAGIVIQRLGRALRKRRQAVHTAVGEVGSAVTEAALGLTAIQAFDVQPRFEKRFEKLSRRIYRATLRALAARALGPPFNEVLGAVALATTLVFATDAIAKGTLLPETFISFFTALFMLYQPVKGIGQAHHFVVCGAAALDRIRPLTPSGDPSQSQAPSPPRLDRSFALTTVTGGYVDSSQILKDINITINRGERIAVVGPSGAGKTSLLNLMLGFIVPDAGQLSIDGHGVPPDVFRRLFAPVRQEPFLFDDTIFENVLIGKETAPKEAVETACRAAGVLAFASALPGGLHTDVGPGGTNLSIGQRQRVALARALLSDMPVLLLDELTASLDGATEKDIATALDTAFGDKTILVVTHRLATATWAKRLVLIEEGRITADGPVETLLKTLPSLTTLFGDQTER